MKGILAALKWLHRFVKRGGGNILLSRCRYLFISRLLRTGLTDAFRGEVSEGAVVIDVGANIGYYTILTSELVGPSGRVFAFEPDPAHFALLERNLVMNGCSNVSAEHCGVSHTAETLKLYLSEVNSSDHSTYFVEGRQCIDVPVVSLDKYCRDKCVERVDLIKIDVQGYEPAVLQGMSDILARNPGVRVFSEFWPDGIRRANFDPLSYLEEFEKLGFEFHLVKERSQPRRISKGEALSLADLHREIDLLFKRPFAGT